ncbi:hypothetical protein BD560DRAFT_434925 [Blakeslea trispora]|nr:hypothetical protein BD560DRAFT_434925 [Blakeslea trispora]
MILDWKRFEKDLKNLQTATQCAEQLPNAGMLLTQASKSSLGQLANQCVVLLANEKSTAVLEKLLLQILKASSNNHGVLHHKSIESLLPNEFIYGLAYQIVHATDTHAHFQQWSTELKTELLLKHNELLVTQIFGLMLLLLENQTSYQDLDTICQKLSKNELLHLVSTSNDLKEALVSTFSNYIIQLSDWRLIRALQCTYRILQYSPLSQSLVKEEEVSPSERYQHTLNFIYGGSFKDTVSRRNIAWCYNLSLNRLIWQCINLLVQWCQQDLPWTSDMENVLAYVNWIIYPSLDHRESQSLFDLRSWIQSSQDGIHFRKTGSTQKVGTKEQHHLVH